VAVRLAEASVRDTTLARLRPPAAAAASADVGALLADFELELNRCLYF
jgi:hypothetical protein